MLSSVEMNKGPWVLWGKGTLQLILAIVKILPSNREDGMLVILGAALGALSR
jgi:hypothetical protein